MKLKPVFVALSITAIAQPAMAQKTAGDTVMKGSTIEVIQAYKPQVRQAPKPEWIPQLPPADTTHLPMNYEVPQQTVYYSYSSEPLRPLALGKDTINTAFPNYVKAGAGNLSTLFLDAGIANFQGRNYETALHLHHMSQKGVIKYQQDALSGLEAEGAYHSKFDWHGTVNVERNQYYYYGSNAGAFVDNADSLKQTYTTLRAAADMQGAPLLGGKLTYHPSLGLSVYDARFNTTESNFNFAAPFVYKIDNTLQASASLIGEFTHTKMDSLGGSNNLFEILPGVILHKGKLSGHAYIGLAGGKGNFYALPDIVANYEVPKTTLVLSGGWQSSVRRNTYEELTTENPYLYHNYYIAQTRKDELFADVSGSAGSHFTYAARVSWWNFKDLAVFMNDVISPNYFNVLYDNVSATSFHVAARYVQSGKWSAGAAADYYEYYQGNLAYVYHKPAFRLKADLAVRPLKGLDITAYAAMLSGIHVIDGSVAKTLNPIMDIGGYAEYQIVSRLSAFIQVSNILNNKYERWLGYQSYGLNVYGGVRLKF